MNTHKLFSEFDKKINLNNSKVSKLKVNRDALRNKIRDHFKSKDWNVPKFYSQGSFPLKTNLNPIKKQTEDGDIKEEYDLDDGVYIICPRNERKEPTTYHDRIKKAVDGHADSVINKSTCVRVVYMDGHHIDLPIYWLEEDGNTPQLAHKSKGFTDSDPKAFKDWADSNISSANSNGQLRRIIRYLKAWKNFQENKNNNLNLPSGFILTILACNNFVKNDRDDLALKNTTEKVKASLETGFSCYRPTIPTDEELLVDYSKSTVLKELEGLISYAQKAIDTDSEKEASEYWQNVFGDRFPLGTVKDDKSTTSTNRATRVAVSAPWSFL